MPIMNSPLADVRVSASTAKLSALSGCGWAVVAYFVGHAAFGYRIWGGIIAAPLIGVLIGHLSKSMEAKTRRIQIVASLFNFYLAATCFAVAMAVFDFVWGPRHVPFSPVLMQHVLGVLWGLTFTGYFLVLWPLSFFNHRLVWRAHAAGGIAAPKVGIAAVNIRAVALKLIALAVLGYVAWALLQVILTTVRSSATSGGALVGPD
jgi:NAD/NADP transhydrogenase beta subunit